VLLLFFPLKKKKKKKKKKKTKIKNHCRKKYLRKIACLYS